MDHAEQMACGPTPTNFVYSLMKLFLIYLQCCIYFACWAHAISMIRILWNYVLLMNIHTRIDSQHSYTKVLNIFSQLYRGLVVLLHGLNEHRYVSCSNPLLGSMFLVNWIRWYSVLNISIFFAVVDTVILRSGWMPTGIRFMESIGLVCLETIWKT